LQQGGDVMHALHRIALGPTGAEHYLPHFALFDALDRTRTTWNWAAAGPSLGWLVYRGLWRQALVYALVVPAIALLWLGVLRPLLGLPPQFEAALALTWLLLASAVPGLWGDAWLYQQVCSRTEQALETATNLAQTQTILQAQAPTRRRLWAVAAAYLLTAAAALALLSILGAPASDTLSPTASAPPAMADAAALPASANLTAASAALPLPMPEAPLPATSAAGDAPGNASSALLAAAPALAAAVATHQAAAAPAALPAPAAPALAATSTSTAAPHITAAPPVVSTARSRTTAAPASPPATEPAKSKNNTKTASPTKAEAPSKSKSKGTDKNTAKATPAQPASSARASRCACAGLIRAGSWSR
jgi:hypothetical protein